MTEDVDRGYSLSPQEFVFVAENLPGIKCQADTSHFVPPSNQIKFFTCYAEKIRVSL
ncbi:hypothetical protein DET1453 [Dehalococcoides mccartyi 195]|uniref:Uncharacterized protein n=1 Tax=Dehalococcoides mccartyi (strain ATCC BAA-2266 / KCTC 15142 / 195) TaxID=243164 RepID=Q3Z6J3_DEHM1|nr:hypothetical protein DET1453 [Dehalococcoides mccartyi 195]